MLIDQEYKYKHSYGRVIDIPVQCDQLYDISTDSPSAMFLLFLAIRNNDIAFTQKRFKQDIQYYPAERKAIENLLSDPEDCQSKIVYYNQENPDSAIQWLIDWWLTFIVSNGTV